MPAVLVHLLKCTIYELSNLLHIIFTEWKIQRFVKTATEWNSFFHLVEKFITNVNWSITYKGVHKEPGTPALVEE